MVVREDKGDASSDGVIGCIDDEDTDPGDAEDELDDDEDELEVSSASDMVPDALLSESNCSHFALSIISGVNLIVNLR